jgi:hypothetical protein
VTGTEARADRVSATTYLGIAAREQLDRLQDELYTHLVSDSGGRCQVCHQAEPCLRHDRLTAAILRYGTLPQGRPGLTKAGLRRAAVPAQVPRRA